MRPAGNGGHAFGQHLLVGQATRLGLAADHRGDAIGVEEAGQQVVDCHVVRHGLARQAGDEAGESGARAVGEPQHVDRHLHRAEVMFTMRPNLRAIM
jgi:hypothetical protein